MKKIFLALILTTSMFTIRAQTAQKNEKNAANGNTAKTVVPSGSFLLYGIFYAPPGIDIVLQNNGKNDITISPKKENGKTFTTTNFNFSTLLAHGAKGPCRFCPE